MKFGVVLSSAAVLGFAAVADAKKPKPGPVSSGCTCYGSCFVKGDPHVHNWFNEEWIATGAHLNILKTKDVSISAEVTKEFHFMETIYFNQEQIMAKNCKKIGQRSHFTAKGVTMTVECSKPLPKTHRGNDFYLDITELKITENSGIKTADYSGVCVSHKPKNSPNPANADKVVFKEAPSIKCECSATCNVWGDPHVDSFYGVDRLLVDKEIPIYEMPDFSIKASVNEFKYMETVTVTGRKEPFKLADCENKMGRNLRSGETLLGQFGRKVKNGKVHGKVLCQTKKGKSMLNIELTKTDFDATSASDFHTMEQHQRATGVCTLEK